ncbi:MAG TPA: PAS domain S-box protein, partial [Nitrospirae bacterium]|nr:PAS domain S-box protein [Nitrospirota bacterium]
MNLNVLQGEMRFNIFLIVLVFVIISFIITLNVFFQQNYQQEMANQFNRQQLLIAKTVSVSISGFYKRMEEELNALSDLLQKRGLNPGGLKEFIKDAFTEVGESKGVAVRIYGRSGKLIFPEEYKAIKRDERLRLARLAARLKKGEIYYLNDIAENRMIKMISPIRRGDVMLGLVVVDISIDAVNKKYLAPIKSGLRGYAWMMNSAGTLIYHPTQENMVGRNIYKADRSCFRCHTSFKTEKMILAASGVGFSSYISPQGEDKLIAFSRISVAQMSWIVCVSIPYSEVTMSIQKSMRLHSMLVLLIFSMTVIGAFIIILINRGRVKAEEKARYFERQRVLEHQIVEAKHYLENILESTQTIIIVMDRNFVIKRVNSAYEEMFNVAKEEMLGKDFMEVFPLLSEEDRGRYRKTLNDCLDGKISHLMDYPVKHNGKVKKLNIIVSPLRFQEKIAGVILSGIDVTEEANLKQKIRDYAHELEEIVKERTKELLSEKEKLNAIVETIEAGICIFDSEKNLIWTNRVMRDWLSEEEICNLGLDNLYSGKYSFDALKHAVVDNRFIQEIVYNDFGRKAGFFQVVSTPFMSPEGESQILVLVQDITEVKKAEEQMMQSEKLSALARLSAGVAHEIGNPLTSISSYVQILKEMDFDEFTRESLEIISRHINRITAIVRQMSSFTGSGDKGIEEKKIDDIIESTFQLVKYDKRMKNIKVNREIPDDLPEVRVNGNQLEQVFINMILNAADAMPEGGELTIRAFSKQDSVDIEISDTGKGIPDENIEKIFDPFFTTK